MAAEYVELHCHSAYSFLDGALRIMPNWESHIAGFTIYNDFSARDIQAKEGQIGAGAGKSKDFDQGNVLGPVIVTPDEIDGADISMQHLIQECEAHEVRIGMRVEPVWKDRSEWGPTLESIAHFRPTGEPDRDMSSEAGAS